jgi:hypothetical protein
LNLFGDIRPYQPSTELFLSIVEGRRWWGRSQVFLVIVVSNFELKKLPQLLEQLLQSVRKVNVLEVKEFLLNSWQSF